MSTVKRMAFWSGLACASVAVAAATVAAPNNPVSIGSIELKGGTEKKTVSTAAMPSTGPRMVGQIVNKTGFPMDDVFIEYKKKSPATTGPKGGTTDLSSTSQTQSADNVDATDGCSANNEFGGTGMAPIANNGACDVSSTLTELGNGSEIEVWFTPSRKVKSNGQHADVIATYELSSNSPTLINALHGPHNTAAIALLTNIDSSSQPLVAIEGTVTFDSLPNTAVQSVSLQAVGGGVLTGMSTSLSGTDFEITGFRQLNPGTSYELVVTFSSVPTSAYRVEVTGVFDD